ncbi:restriction endonuclease subunit S [Moraxella macacae]|nr:restriction endonuclease subunit S [Moraxella macacae]
MIGFIERLLQGRAVEWKSLGEIFDIFAGGDVPKNAFSKIQTKEFNIPILSNGINEKSLYGWTNEAKINQPSLTISARGTIGWTSYQEKPFFPIVRLLVLTPKIELNIKFAYHFMKLIENDYKIPKSGIPQLTKPMIKDLKIPIPPLDVQNEIVRILDKFTALNSELIKELDLRKKQYSYYRDKLLTFGDEVEYKTLSEVAQYSKDRINFNKVNASNHISVNNLLQDRKGKINSTTLPTNGTLIQYQQDDILLGNIRPYLRKIWFADNCGGTNGDVLVIRATYEKLLPKYLFYILSDEKFFLYNIKNSKGAKMPRGDKDLIMEFKFPIPPIATQQKIITILDKFETLTNSISHGLPKEINLRQKQYEYYREQLLTFDK